MILSFCTSTLSPILYYQTMRDLFWCRVLRAVWCCLETPILYSVLVSYEGNVEWHILTKHCCASWSFVYCIGKVVVPSAHVTSVMIFGTGYYCVNHLRLNSTKHCQFHDHLMYHDTQMKIILSWFNSSSTWMSSPWVVLDHQGLDNPRWTHSLLGSTCNCVDLSRLGDKHPLSTSC